MPDWTFCLCYYFLKFCLILCFMRLTSKRSLIKKFEGHDHFYCAGICGSYVYELWVCWSNDVVVLRIQKNFFSSIFIVKKRNWKTFFHNDTQFFYFVHKCLIKKKISSRLFFWQTCAIYYICYTPFRTKTVHMWRSTNVWKSGKNEKKQSTVNFVYSSFKFSFSRENFAFPISTSSNRLFGLVNIFFAPNSLFSFLPYPRSDWTFHGRKKIIY